MSGTGDNNLNQQLQQGQGDRRIEQQPIRTGPGNRMSNRARAARLRAAYRMEGSPFSRVGFLVSALARLAHC